MLAKKNVTTPTSLTYDEALEEALCHGWIDGRRRSRDEQTFIQHYTPRRSRSMWSQRNVELVARMERDGRMRPAGRAEVERAKADGRWDKAYSGSSTLEIPADLAEALAAGAAGAGDVRHPHQCQPICGGSPREQREAGGDEVEADRPVRRAVGARRDDLSAETHALS